MEGSQDKGNFYIEGNGRTGSGTDNANFSQIGIDMKKQSLAEVKKKRKDIERDAQLLANRIALLKQEEMKTWKKIEETKKRTNEIQSLKHRNEEKGIKKEEDIHTQQESQKQNQQSNYYIQKQRQEEKRKIQEAIYLSKKEEANQTKIMKQLNENKKRTLYNNLEQENRLKNQIINQ